ncbi:MAG: hypothetical protein R3335_07605 [Anaerolineales bacterium]|nr:hypothetical protein [Anaerolineales bacterium]
MDTVYDSKGKFFTDVITKGTVKVIVQTQLNRLEGCLHIQNDERVIDALNRSKSFLALTDVVIYGLGDGQKLYEADFLTVNKMHVQWVLPMEDLEETDPGAGGTE